MCNIIIKVLWIEINLLNFCFRLRLLNVFEPCTLQVGDRNFYTFHEGDTVITKEQWRRMQKEVVITNSAGHGYIPPIVCVNPVKRRTKQRALCRGSTSLQSKYSWNVREQAVIDFLFKAWGKSICLTTRHFEYICDLAWISDTVFNDPPPPPNNV